MAIVDDVRITVVVYSNVQRELVARMAVAEVLNVAKAENVTGQITQTVETEGKD